MSDDDSCVSSGPASSEEALLGAPSLNTISTSVMARAGDARLPPGGAIAADVVAASRCSSSLVASSVIAEARDSMYVRMRGDILLGSLVSRSPSAVVAPRSARRHHDGGGAAASSSGYAARQSQTGT